MRSKPEPPSVILDDRERASGLDRAIEEICGLAPRIERLEVGDILIRSRVLIERKAVADFVASIVDGRLFDQVSRLRAEPFEPMIILEGDFTADASGEFAPAALRGAMLSLSLDWHLPVLRSRSVNDTARWICALLRRRETRQESPDWRWVSPTGRRRPQKDIRLRPARKTIPPAVRRTRQRIQMLSQIEGVGVMKAESLLDRFQSLSAIFSASRQELVSVPGIGRRLAEVIHEALHGEAAPTPKACDDETEGVFPGFELMELAAEYRASSGTEKGEQDSLPL